MSARIVLTLAAAVLFTAPITARAHCDTLGGPVVSSARAARGHAAAHEGAPDARNDLSLAHAH